MPARNLQLIIEENSPNFIEITIANKDFANDRSSYRRKLIFAAVTYLLVIKASWLIHVPFWIALLLFGYCYANLVEREHLKVAKDFGVEKSLTTCSGHQRMFIPRQAIKKVVINEVIYFVSNQ